MSAPGSLQRYAWLSIAAACVTISLKTGAFALTGSVGLLSDALESTVNLVAAIAALLALRLAERPADAKHHFGHGKAEYFSAAAEGGMIFLAAAAIVVTAVPRFLHPKPLEQVGLGLAITVVASLVNLAVAIVLLRTGRAHRSLTLIADGKHLLTDVWTSAGVVVAVAAVAVTGVERLDPTIAVLVAVNILITGARLVGQSASGLMDPALSAEEHAVIERVFDDYRRRGADFHALRTRQAGRQRFVTVHVLVPGAWTVQAGHDLLEHLERDLARALPGLIVFTHLEPAEDPASFADIELGADRWN